MNYTKSAVLVILLVIFQFSAVFGQNAFDNPYLNRSVLRHFTGDRLSEMELQDSTKFNQVKYYFTQSFIVQDITCHGCEMDYDVFFNSDLFDVSNFESLREDQTPYIFLFNNGQYEITLLPINEVEAQLGGLPVESVLQLRLLRPFPRWIEYGDDYAIYSRDVELWAIDFPNEYRALTSSPKFLKIRLDEFNSLSQVRKDRLFYGSGGYMIIE